MSNETCHIHDGFRVRLETLEKNMESLWKKWDKITWLLIANLMSAIFLIVKVWVL